MKLYSLYEIDTASQRFTMTIHCQQGNAWVARYWNQPNRPDPLAGRQLAARIVAAPSMPWQQWCGEVCGQDAESAIRTAREQIEFLDGPIRHFTRSDLYGPDVTPRHPAKPDSATL